MKILFFEPHITGHRQEYLNHLIEYVSANPSEHEYIFAVHQEFKPEITSPKITLEKVSSRRKACPRESVGPGPLRIKRNFARTLSRSLSTFRLAHHFALKHRIDHLCFLNFNDVQFALGLFRPKYSISGILFKPYSRKVKGSIGIWLTWQRKFVQTWAYVQNKRVKTVFVLNDHKAEDFLNQTFGTCIFQMLPDPVPELTPELGYNLRDEFNIPANRKIFLHIGSLLKRKGTLDILDSLQYLTEDELSQFTLLILGHAEPDMDREIRQRLSSPDTRYPTPDTLSSTRYPIPDTRYQNSYLSPQVFKSCLDQCDLVLVPYKYPESSSGLAGHAIAAGKPMLAVRDGLLGDTVAEHGVGIFISGGSPELIAEGLRKALRVELKGKVSKRYLQNHTKEIFSRSVVKAITR